MDGLIDWMNDIRTIYHNSSVLTFTLRSLVFFSVPNWIMHIPPLLYIFYYLFSFLVYYRFVNFGLAFPFSVPSFLIWCFTSKFISPDGGKKRRTFIYSLLLRVETALGGVIYSFVNTWYDVIEIISHFDSSFMLWKGVLKGFCSRTNFKNWNNELLLHFHFNNDLSMEKSLAFTSKNIENKVPA